ncbi:MAG: allantoinase AllB [Chthoniobacterales bacterium]
MAEAELIVRGAAVCLPDGLRETSVAVAEGCIVAIGDDVSATTEVDGRGQFLLPGAIDAHVHYNEPGRTGWEGWASGSAASAAGGASCVFEMPLNASPPTLDAESFGLKRAAAEASSVLDFALWGGLTPVNLDRMEELATCGVIGFKAFLSGSGMEDFPRANERTLRAGMAQAAALDLPVAVHAEDEEMTARLAAEAGAAGRCGVRDYLASRPIAAELAAIRLACETAGETDCRLHVVHVSCREGLTEIAAARGRGVDVTAETCPHYLVLNEEDVERLGAVAKCAPPLRAEQARADLVRCVRRGEVDTLGTDHSPCPPSMKQGEDFFRVWGGIMGAQQFLPALWSVGLGPEAISRLTGSQVAARFGLSAKKGTIAVGLDADLLLIDPRQPYRCEAGGLLTRHAVSPYVGREFPVSVTSVWVRGRAAWSAALGPGHARGCLVTPVC